MVQFISQRFVSGLLSLIFIVTIISSIIYMAPVDPATLSFGQQMSEKALELKQKELYLDKSVGKQIALYLNDLSPLSVYKNSSTTLQKFKSKTIYQGEKQSLLIKMPYFRESYQTGERVWTTMIRVLPNTIILALSSILIASVIGIFLGIIAALNKDTWLDGFIVSLSTLGYSVPSYVSAILLSLIFGFYLKNWTGLNMQGSLLTLNDLGDEVTQWKNLILPLHCFGGSACSSDYTNK